MSDNEGTRFSPQPTKSKCCCAVRDCFSKACTHLTLRFHSFPGRSGADFIFLPNQSGEVEKVCRRDVWLQRLKMDNVNTDNKRICSLHFKRRDYVLPNAPSQKRYLKRDAIPSCNLPQDKILMETESNDSLEPVVRPEIVRTYEKCNKIKLGANRPVPKTTLIKEEPPDLDIKMEPLDEEIDESYLHNNQSEIDSSRIPIKEENIEIKYEPVDKIQETNLHSHFKRLWDPSSIVVSTGLKDKSIFIRNVATQTDRGISVSKLMNVLKTDKDLNILTGIPNFRVLGTIVDVLEVVSPRLTRVDGLSLGIEDRIIMTFMKLKQDLNYGALSALFKCRSKRSCKRIIIQTLDTMSRALKPAIRWPEKHEISTNLSTNSGELSNVRCVINRIEIAVRRPKEIPQRIATFSRYKRYHSLKFMTAVNLNGSICFLSKVYGGRTCSKTIFEESNIVKLLEKKDALIAIKDFPIDNICKENNIKLVKSLYKQKSTKSAEENPVDYRIRLNVNRRFRRFRIFRRKLTNTLTSKTEHILTILCAVENLSLLNPTITSSIRS